MLKLVMAMMATTAFVSAAARDAARPTGTFARMHRAHQERIANRMHDRMHDEMRARMMQRRPSIRALDDYRREMGDYEEDNRGRPVMEEERPGPNGYYADGTWAGSGSTRMRPTTRMDDIREPGDASRAMREDLRACGEEVRRLQELNGILSQQLTDIGIEPGVTPRYDDYQGRPYGGAGGGYRPGY